MLDVPVNTLRDGAIRRGLLLTEGVHLDRRRGQVGRGRQQHARGLLLFRAPCGRLLDERVDIEPVNLETRFHDLLLEREIDLLEARVDLLQREHALIDDGNAERRRRGVAAPVRHRKLQRRFIAGLVRFRVERYGDTQGVGGIHVQAPRVAQQVRAGCEGVRLQDYAARQRGIQIQFECRAAILEVRGSGHHGLAVADDVKVNGPRRFRREDFRAQRISHVIQRLFRPQQQAFRAAFDLERDGLFRRAAFAVPLLHHDHRGIRVGGHYREFRRADRIGLYVKRLGRAGHDHSNCGRLRGRAVGIGHEQIDPVLQVRTQLAAFRHGMNRKRGRRHGFHDHLFFAVVGRIDDHAFQAYRGLALFERGTRKVVGQPGFKGPVAVCVERALQRREFRELDLEFRRRQRHFPAGNGLAEEVVGLHLAFQRIARQVILAVRRDVDFELGQHVPVDGHLFLRGDIVQQHAHDIRPEVHFGGQLKIGGSHAERIRLLRLLENLVPLRVHDFKDHVAFRHRPARSHIKAQRA